MCGTRLVVERGVRCGAPNEQIAFPAGPDASPIWPKPFCGVKMHYQRVLQTLKKG